MMSRGVEIEQTYMPASMMGCLIPNCSVSGVLICCADAIAAFEDGTMRNGGEYGGEGGRIEMRGKIQFGTEAAAVSDKDPLHPRV